MSLTSVFGSLMMVSAFLFELALAFCLLLSNILLVYITVVEMAVFRSFLIKSLDSGLNSGIISVCLSWFIILFSKNGTQMDCSALHNLVVIEK
jgi:hypothetical protein